MRQRSGRTCQWRCAASAACWRKWSATGRNTAARWPACRPGWRMLRRCSTSQRATNGCVEMFETFRWNAVEWKRLCINSVNSSAGVFPESSALDSAAHGHERCWKLSDWDVRWDCVSRTETAVASSQRQMERAVCQSQTCKTTLHINPFVFIPEVSVSFTQPIIYFSWLFSSFWPSLLLYILWNNANIHIGANIILVTFCFLVCESRWSGQTEKRLWRRDRSFKGIYWHGQWEDEHFSSSFISEHTDISTRHRGNQSSQSWWTTKGG